VTYVTGAAIIAHVKGSAYSATADETAWGGKCADAIEAAIAARLDGATPSAGGTDELEVAALQDGAALYNSKAAPHGILSIGPDGDIVRLGADYVRQIEKVMGRVGTTAGIGIG